MNEMEKKLQKITGSQSIDNLTNEYKKIQEVEKIIKSKEINDEKKQEEIEKLEKYLAEKQNDINEEKDIEYLKKIAKELRTQSTRKTDKANPALFKIVSEFGEERYFITRKALEEYQECNKQEKGKVIEIASGDSEELNRLLDIIKRIY